MGLLSARTDANPAQSGRLPARMKAGLRMRWLVLSTMVLLVCCVVWVVGAYLLTTRATGALPTAQRMHVCTYAHFDNNNAACTRDDAVISSAEFDATALKQPAQVIYSGKNGNTFTTPAVTFIISRQRDNGAGTEVGHTIVTHASDYKSAYQEALPLAVVFDQAGVTPKNGTIYQVEVDEGRAKLGTTRFTYRS